MMLKANSQNRTLKCRMSVIFYNNTNQQPQSVNWHCRHLEHPSFVFFIGLFFFELAVPPFTKIYRGWVLA